MDLKIQNIEKKDSERIEKLNTYLAKLNAEEFDDTFNKEWVSSESYSKYFESCFGQDSLVCIAIVNGEDAGYINGSILKSPDYRIKMKIAEIENLMVLPRFQRVDIGSKLYKHFASWSKENGAQRISLSVYSKNKRAKKFYKQLGFESYDESWEINI